MNLFTCFLSVTCPACKTAIIGDPNKICEACEKKLPTIIGKKCPACGGAHDGIFDICTNCMKEDKRPWEKAYALFQMKGYGQQLIHSYKYNQQTALARPFGNMLAEQLQDHVTDIDYITPVPLHWIRFLSRGYNQSELICNVLSKGTGIPVKKLLKRQKWTRQQAKLSREERRRNINNVFSVKREAICKNSTILLVDDVLTTGSTLVSATRELLNAGADRVYIMILARGY